MDVELLIHQGNLLREQRRPHEALACYAQAFVADLDSVSAWNNYGNVMREIGRPDRALPFLEHALRLDPRHEIANFNLAVCYLLLGDYQRGWKQYESRWNFEHLKGTMPNFGFPRWTGQDLKDKTILITGEQGLGDNIQFVRFAMVLHGLGARIKLMVPDTLIPLFGSGEIITQTLGFNDPSPQCDYWVPMMSIPGVIGTTLETLPNPLSYLIPDRSIQMDWAKRLGLKKKLRVGFSWSGRRDTWINQHKSVPFEYIKDMVSRAPTYEWINLQIDASEEESQVLADAGVKLFPGTVSNMSDTAGLLANLDVVISIDSAVSHLAGSMGIPTWLMLNQYATDWRWFLDRNDSPWYPSVRIFRQPAMDQWQPVVDRILGNLALFKI